MVLNGKNKGFIYNTEREQVLVGIGVVKIKNEPIVIGGVTKRTKVRTGQGSRRDVSSTHL